MNRQEFLKQFLSALEPLTPEERSQISEYYEELICDGLEEGLSEEEVLARFGSPEEEAARIREENPREAAASEPFVFSPDGEADTLDCSAKDVSIRLLPFEGEGLQIRFEYDKERAKVESWTEGNVWHFRHTPARKRFRELFGIGLRRGEITVLVPREFSGTLLLRTQNGKISGEQLSPLSRVEAVTTNAGIQFASTSFGTLTITTSNASVRVTDCTGETLKAHTSNGGLRAQNAAFDSQSWETSNSSVRMAGIRAIGFSAATSNAGISVSDCEAEQLSLSTSNGSVSVDGVSGDELHIATSNASITGSVRGNPMEYQIYAATSNAPCNLENSADPTRPKKLTARTSNGKINLMFG